MCRYNVLDSQRPGAIGRAYEAPHIGGWFGLASFPNKVDGVKKIEDKDRKRTDCTTAFRRAIAPADDIALRVQLLYESNDPITPVTVLLYKHSALRVISGSPVGRLLRFRDL